MENKIYIISDDILASHGQRIGNSIIDTIVRYIIMFLLGLIIALFAQLTGQSSILEWLVNIGKLEEFLIGLTVILIYYTVMEATLSRTLGKYITKTIVVMADGSKPDTVTIIKRTLCRFIPIDFLTYFGTPSRGWHDSISDTWVVKKEEFEREKELFYSFEEIGNSDN